MTIYLLNKYLLSTYWMLDTILNIRDLVKNKIDKIPVGLML